ncbi:MAG: hypothetical protein ACYCW6_03490 [Candidatus Xenobia bacterium]
MKKRIWWFEIACVIIVLMIAAFLHVCHRPPTAPPPQALKLPPQKVVTFSAVAPVQPTPPRVELRVGPSPGAVGLHHMVVERMTPARLGGVVVSPATPAGTLISGPPLTASPENRRPPLP